MYHETECGCGQHGHEEARMGHGYGGAVWGHHGYPGWGRIHHGSGCCCRCHCGCGWGSGWQHHGEFGRRFISKEEVIGQLEEYLKQLRAEAKGVEERIAELKKAST